MDEEDTSPPTPSGSKIGRLAGRIQGFAREYTDGGSQNEYYFDGALGLVVGGWEILSRRVQRAAEKQMEEAEPILFCLRGDLSHSLIAFDDRILIVKPGFMAGTTFGVLTATFYYRDITGFELNTGLITAVLEVSTPSHQATARRSWVQIGSLKDHYRDPYRLSNCIPLFRKSLKNYEPYVAELRAKLREAKAAPPSLSAPGIAAQLEQLAALHASGALSDDEFQRAKASILGTLAVAPHRAATPSSQNRPTHG